MVIRAARADFRPNRGWAGPEREVCVRVCVWVYESVCGRVCVSGGLSQPQDSVRAYMRLEAVDKALLSVSAVSVSISWQCQLAVSAVSSGRMGDVRGDVPAVCRPDVDTSVLTGGWHSNPLCDVVSDASRERALISC